MIRCSTREETTGLGGAARELVADAVMIGDAASLARALDEHIRVQTDAVDFERIIAERRQLRTQRKPESEHR